jgi:cytochrome c oxidase subunit 3
VSMALNLDVSRLPKARFGAHAPIWWGIVGMCTIEGTMLAMMIASYLYLRLNSVQWPPAGTNPPALGAGTANLLVMLISVIPMWWIDTHAENGRRGWVQATLVAAVAFNIIALVLRAYEFPAMKCRWDTHAYGSLVWTILGLHAGHLLASTIENAFLAVVAFRRPLDDHHRLDLEMNAIYWFFIVGAWIPLYVVVYWGPRLL